MASPLNFLWILILLGSVLHLFKQGKINRLLALGLVLFLTLGVLPVGHNLMAFLERQYQRPVPMPSHVDGIIVLGGGFDTVRRGQTGMMAANNSVTRVMDFVALAQKYPKAKLVFSGGSGNILYKGKIKEADSAAEFFELTDIRHRAVLYERESRNTFENVKNTKVLISPQKGEIWIVVTSASHIPRTMGVFAEQGWDVLPYPSGPKTDLKYKLIPSEFNVERSFSLLTSAIKEFIGSAIYYFSGKSAFLLPVSSLKS